MRIKPIKTVFAFGLLTLLMAFDYPGLKSEANELEWEGEDSTEYNACKMENSVFQGGEEVVYKLFYNWNFVWLAAGEVTFRVRDLGDKYHLSAHGRTYSSYEWFFKVRDKYDTYVDKETLLPIISIRDISEGKYRLFDHVTFDKTRNKAISNRGKSRFTAEVTEYDIESCMHDILSIIYYTRNVDFNKMKPGAEIPIKIFMDKETWPLTVKYHGKEVKKVRNNGKNNTIKFTPEVIVGDIFNEGTQMMVWVSDDENKIPLLIESPVSVGSVKVVLKSYKGLKYDFEAALN